MVPMTLLDCHDKMLVFSFSRLSNQSITCSAPLTSSCVSRTGRSVLNVLAIKSSAGDFWLSSGVDL